MWFQRHEEPKIINEEFEQVRREENFGLFIWFNVCYQSNFMKSGAIVTEIINRFTDKMGGKQTFGGGEIKL